jgi:hypothetical protein
MKKLLIIGLISAAAAFFLRSTLSGITGLSSIYSAGQNL